jgi:hypothetical protein
VNYLPPFRPYPPREFLISSRDYGFPGEGVKDEFRGWTGDSAALATANEWLASPDRLKTSYELRAESYVRAASSDENGPTHIDRIGLYDKARDMFLSFRDVGVGISQVIPVLLTALSIGSKSDEDIYSQMLVIEQPELHLHPALQAELADLFLIRALGEIRSTTILETHSEHLLLRVMRRVRETHLGTLPPEIPPVKASDVAILYVENLGERSVVREMPLNERGELVFDWPGGFFEEGLREVLM